MAGYIYDYRKEVESDIWLMPPLYHRSWQWIKYKAFHSPAKIPNKDGTFTDIQPGQFPTSYRNIAKGVGYYEQRRWVEPNVKTVKAIIDWLVVNSMIAVSGNTLGTIITVANWGLYQKELPCGNGKETRRKHRTDTNNKDISNVEVIKENLYVRFDEFWTIYPRKANKKKAQEAWKKVKADDIDNIIADVKYMAKSKDWTKEDGKYIPHPTTYINGERWKDNEQPAKQPQQELKIIRIGTYCDVDS